MGVTDNKHDCFAVVVLKSGLIVQLFAGKKKVSFNHGVYENISPQKIASICIYIYIYIYICKLFGTGIRCTLYS